jgi:hypothetical protein
MVFQLSLDPSDSDSSKVKTPSKRPAAPECVYEFVDPDSDSAVYVGRGVNVERCVNQHLRVAMTTGLFSMWIAEKVQNDKRPLVRVVAYGNSRSEASALEQERINMHVTAGNKLFNQKAARPRSQLEQYVTIEQLSM